MDSHTVLLCTCISQWSKLLLLRAQKFYKVCLFRFAQVDAKKGIFKVYRVRQWSNLLKMLEMTDADLPIPLVIILHVG